MLQILMTTKTLLTWPLSSLLCHCTHLIKIVHQGVLKGGRKCLNSILTEWDINKLCINWHMNLSTLVTLIDIPQVVCVGLNMEVSMGCGLWCTRMLNCTSKLPWLVFPHDSQTLQILEYPPGSLSIQVVHQPEREHLSQECTWGYPCDAKCKTKYETHQQAQMRYCSLKCREYYDSGI